MNVLNKLLIAGLLAGSIATPVLAADTAQPAPQEKSYHHMDPAQREAWIAKRQQELHDKLKLRSNQETAWQRFATAWKPNLHEDFPSRDAIAKMSAPERMDLELKHMKQHEIMMGQRLEALKTFYAQLTPDQKKTFDAETMPRHHHDGAEGHEK
ncbi:Spy/CpxP family protein refolding chaperone [Crenobacter sp. SG2303]|uniref:Spy/CpxP family protein refolding chaperone n=1 Tax=Crenobacter oryzisoli TaxID=3056844 RepID=A0ABT7XUS2_9NEIS|nr:Spy/CpxP family protein refolding chaperone [Crenobacter sp. SG2303]MDN0077551.1 Spy/CpxP family protein refolding chaperone [Crenobacter sp. SG2303]